MGAVPPRLPVPLPRPRKRTATMGNPPPPPMIWPVEFPTTWRCAYCTRTNSVGDQTCAGCGAAYCDPKPVFRALPWPAPSPEQTRRTEREVNRITAAVALVGVVTMGLTLLHAAGVL